MTQPAMRLAAVGSPADLIADYRSLDVVVALENELIRLGICTMFGQLPTVGSLTSCSTCDEAAERLAGRAADIVVLPGAGPEQRIAGIAELSARAGAKVLLLLEDSGYDCIDRALAARPDGFLLQSELTLSVLDETVERLVRGGLPMPPVVARQLLSRAGRARAHSGPENRARPLLTTRERQALGLLSEGFSNKQIARRLGVSENSAKRHVGNVLAKLNCPNRTLAVAWALKAGLINQP